ncbi:hypothetical protein [Rufibacter tibetensis]|uniref:Uncharacterized protein n=1 Tax=Rufibacter tibetensis TaxID=512763 RepID=A0A0P0CPT9_9BACT|nr:hypothetical protein [Rufibacter tibetensis]ALJ01740.1 hypothetical protein DC20_22135 [Rufibacter tibetensis]
MSTGGIGFAENPRSAGWEPMVEALLTCFPFALRAPFRESATEVGSFGNRVTLMGAGRRQGLDLFPVLPWGYDFLPGGRI